MVARTAVPEALTTATVLSDGLGAYTRPDPVSTVIDQGCAPTVTEAT